MSAQCALHTSSETVIFLRPHEPGARSRLHFDWPRVTFDRPHPTAMEPSGQNCAVRSIASILHRRGELRRPRSGTFLRCFFDGADQNGAQERSFVKSFNVRSQAVGRRLQNAQDSKLRLLVYTTLVVLRRFVLTKFWLLIRQASVLRSCDWGRRMW